MGFNLGLRGKGFEIGIGMVLLFGGAVGRWGKESCRDLRPLLNNDSLVIGGW